MYKCRDCGHRQKEENKFHCINCNSFKIEWETNNVNADLNKCIRDIATLQSRMYGDLRDKLYYDLFELGDIPKK